MVLVLVLSSLAAALAFSATVGERTQRSDANTRKAQVQADSQISRTRAEARPVDLSRSTVDPVHAVVQTEQKTYAADEVAYYLSADELVYIRPGLNITIQSITIPADRKPVVTFQMTDDKGQPLDRSGVLSPGAVSTSFILAYLPPTTKGEVTDYVAYTTRTQTSPITGVKAVQAGTDSGGTYTPSGLNDGVYTYKFATALPATYITTATHTLGVYATRSLTEFGLTLYVSNVTKDWVPSGAAVTQVHRVVLTANCNQCHDPLALHGSTGRRAVEICILCHNPGVIDPDTGNTVDMKVMIHKIHRSGNLPSVIAGTPYTIIGNAQSVNDFSDITYPQDIRNCQTCHKDASQVNAWNLQPSMDACGSCHDDVNFATGANHDAGRVGPLADNSKCAQCHQPQGQFEFDASVIGAHVVPYKSKQLLNPKVNIFSVTNTAPGQNPVLRFSITDKNGALIPLSQFTGTTGRLSVNFIGPTTEYSATRGSETVSNIPAYVNGVATYTFTYKIPATATGTWVMETECRLDTKLIINGDPKNLSASQRDAALNTTTFIAVTDRTPVARRSIVSIDNCNKCHDQLGKASFDLSTFHGGGRNQAEVCSICHTTTFVSGGTTPISFQVMIHRIHTGSNLTNSYVVGGTDFKEVTYPGDRRDCTACHVGTSYQVPLPATNLAVTTPNWYWTPTLPTAAACLGCHDTTTTAAHAFINTTVLGGKSVESCEVCHKESADFAVTKVHAR
jgi:OmcA/MtrC family decaheme c-type cytochrome